jgi:hypothetical protein
MRIFQNKSGLFLEKVWKKWYHYWSFPVFSGYFK